jgi:hypothetical protein
MLCGNGRQASYGDPDDLYLSCYTNNMGSYWSKKKDHGENKDEPDVARKTTQWQVVRLKREVRIEDLPEDIRSMFVIRKTGSVVSLSGLILIANQM